MDIYTQMRDALRTVAERRRERDVLALEVKRVNADLAMTHGGLFANAKTAKEDAALVEDTAKALVRAHWEMTDEAKPVAGVTVKQMTRCEYPADLALAWAREKRMALVPESLNTTAFEAIMAATAEADRPMWVTFTKIPQVQLATDLSEYLAEPTPTEADA